MSGYEKGTVSSLGGGIPGKVEVGFQNTLVGSQNAMDRKKLRKAFKTNKIRKNGTTIDSISYHERRNPSL